MSNYTEILNDAEQLLGHLPVSKEGGRLRNILYVTSTQAYEKPAWLKFVLVKGVGGGGGGGGTAATTTGQVVSSGGGQAGGYGEKRILASALAESETVTIGAGGVPSAAGETVGGTGGTTSFGSHLSLGGGIGGAGCAAKSTSTSFVSNGGNGGGAVVGADVGITGAPGGTTSFFSGNLGVRGYGAASPLSRRALGVNTGLGVDDGNGYLYGGGGGGQIWGPSTAAKAGTPGAPGIVIIEEYE